MYSIDMHPIYTCWRLAAVFAMTRRQLRVLTWLDALAQEWVAPLRRALPSRRLLSSLAAGGAAHVEALSRAAIARLRMVRAGPILPSNLLCLCNLSSIWCNWHRVGRYHAEAIARNTLTILCIPCTRAVSVSGASPSAGV